jgi:hypothetical protein
LEELIELNRMNINHAQVLLSSSSKPWAELPEDVRLTFDSNSGAGTYPPTQHKLRCGVYVYIYIS